MAVFAWMASASASTTRRLLRRPTVEIIGSAGSALPSGRRDGKTRGVGAPGCTGRRPEEVGMSIMGFEPFRDFDRLTSQLVSGRRVPHGVALDAWRSGDAYRVALDLPGVDPERIELICERNGLTIRAERAADYGEQDEVLIAGDELDTQAIRADYRNGVLHVTIPVAATAQPRRIQVTQTAEPAGQPKTVDVADPKPTAAAPRD